MSDERRIILEDVAEGRLSPEEAAERLDALGDTPGRQRSEPGEPQRDTPPPPEGIKRVRISGVVGTLAVIGEPGVAGGSATGAHRARYEGDTLVIEAGDEGSGGWFQESQGGRSWGHGRSYGLGGLAGGIGRWKTPLEVRMNPDLPLDVDLTAGSVVIRDLHAAVKLDVLAGNVRMVGVTGPLEVGVGSGTIGARAKVAQGQSRVRCELGNVNIHLEPGSNVQVTGRAHVGKVSLPGRDRGFGAGQVEDTAIVGTGEATLDVETSAGAITVTYTS
ncbi:MAG: SHOCT-like domain-containing protein [Egibacteraceae bacterium]